MKKEHVISDELFNEVQAELSKGKFWFAYNPNSYFLDKGDLYSFKEEDEARQFARNNISDLDEFKVLQAYSVVSLMRQLPYGEDIHFNLTEKELDDLFKSFNWTVANYDPLQAAIKVDTHLEKDGLARMETLLVEWENLYDRNPEAALQLAVTHWEGQPMEQYKNDFINIKNDLMNEQNLDYLKSNIRNHGFGETLGPELEAQLQKGPTEFTLPYKTEVNKREIDATLYFKKSDTTELYFFNKYDTRIKNEKDEPMAQTFYINKGWGVTLKEAYNLLNGRAVHKELTNKEDQKYKAWIQLDFSAKDKHGNYERKQYHENYGYNVKDALSFYPVKEMIKESEAKDLVRSLERGNVQMVSLESMGKEVKVFIEANPQYKSINIYDNRMKKLDQEQRESWMKKPEMNEAKGKDKEQSKGLGSEEQGEKKPDKARKKSDDLENRGLVKKKNNNPSKGMGVH